MRAARARNVRPDGVRSPSIQAGLGVTAVAASGQALVVGTRGLMLRERISVASAEARITDLETMGRSVLLIALGGRLVGLVGTARRPAPRRARRGPTLARRERRARAALGRRARNL